jgi:hypothetical protein
MYKDLQQYIESRHSTGLRERQARLTCGNRTVKISVTVKNSGYEYTTRKLIRPDKF